MGANISGHRLRADVPSSLSAPSPGGGEERVVQPATPGGRHMSTHTHTERPHVSPQQPTAFPGSAVRLKNKKALLRGGWHTVCSFSQPTSHPEGSTSWLVTAWVRALLTRRGKWAMSPQYLQTQDTAAHALGCVCPCQELPLCPQPERPGAGTVSKQAPCQA